MYAEAASNLTGLIENPYNARKVRFFRIPVVRDLMMLRCRPTPALGKLHCGVRGRAQGPLWAVLNESAAHTRDSGAALPQASSETQSRPTASLLHALAEIPSPRLSEIGRNRPATQTAIQARCSEIVTVHGTVADKADLGSLASHSCSRPTLGVRERGGQGHFELDRRRLFKESVPLAALFVLEDLPSVD